MIDTSYEDDIKINENRLDWEWGRQASLMMKWSGKHALATKRRFQAEQQLRIAKAEGKWAIDKLRATIDQDIRLYPEDYGFKKDEKPAEHAISNAINRDKELSELNAEQERKIKEANDALIDAVEEEGVYAAAVKAMQHRKKSLEALAQLYYDNYHAEPRQPGSSEERYERTRRTGMEMRDGMNRDRRR